MAKRKVSRSGGGKKASPPSPSTKRGSGFKYAVRDSRGRFISTKDKEREDRLITQIRKKNPNVKTNKQVNDLLYNPENWMETDYQENAIEGQQNFENYLLSKPKIRFIDTEGVPYEFTAGQYGIAEALFSENASALWRVATLLQEEKVNRDLAKGKKPKTKTLIPEWSTRILENVAGQIKVVEIDFSRNNLNRIINQLPIDKSEFE